MRKSVYCQQTGNLLTDRLFCMRRDTLIKFLQDLPEESIITVNGAGNLNVHHTQGGPDERHEVWTWDGVIDFIHESYHKTGFLENVPEEETPNDPPTHFIRE